MPPSPSARERLDAARAFLRESGEAYVVANTRGAADDLVRSLKATTFGIHRFSLAQLAFRVAAGRLAERNLTPLSRLAAQASAAHVAYRLRSEGKLPYLSAVSDFPGFAPSLSSTLSELRAAGVEEVEGDIGSLLAAYGREMEVNAHSDSAVLFETAAEVLREAPIKAAVLLLDLKVGSAAEQLFVDELVAGAANVFRSDEPQRHRGRRGETALDRLRDNLFERDEIEEKDFDDSVVFFSAPGEGREAVEIVRAIAGHARDGVGFDEMAVFLRAPARYQAHLEAAFERAGIPAYFARGSRRPDPAGRALLALLACAAERLSARRFGEYLSLGQVPLTPSGAEWRPPEDFVDEFELQEESGGANEAVAMEPYRWEALLVEASVIGGKERWHRRLKGLDAELRRRISELTGEEPESGRIEVLQRQLDRLRQLSDFALPIIARLDDLWRCKSWREWIDALRELAGAALRRPDRVLEVLAELEPMAEISPVTLDEVRVTLSERLSSLEVRPPKRRFGRVFVAPIEQAAGRSFNVVFVPGLVERGFPQRVREDPLLLDSVRRRLTGDDGRQPRRHRGHREGLQTNDERAADERLLLQTAIGAAEEKLYVSYPRLDAAAGRSRVASFYALDVIRAVTGRIPDARELEEMANRTIGSRLAWPAPADPRSAIDDLEHDLATLERRLVAPSPGGARYLLELNGWLAESLRARYGRWELQKWNRYDGITRKNELLEKSSLRARPYSPSALQKYAACPYQFFLSAIVRIEPREEPEPPVRLDALTRGTIIHAMHATTLRRLKAKGMLPLRPDAVAAAEKILHAVVDEIASEWEEELAPAIPRVWSDEITLIRTDLRLWLREIAAETDQWVAEKCEYAFGLEQRPEYDETSVPAPVTLPEGFLLRGSVDLIERRAAMLEDLRVSDYKTGANRTRDGLVIGGGETLQPLLYALAVEKLFAMPVAVSRLFFSTSRGGFARRDVSINTTTREMALWVLDQIDAAVTGGFLPPAPRVNTKGRRFTACDYCDFSTVCGPYEPVRAARKDGERLASLERLRDEK
jgi:RecB family exonuclease